MFFGGLQIYEIGLCNKSVHASTDVLTRSQSSEAPTV